MPITSHIVDGYKIFVHNVPPNHWARPPADIPILYNGLQTDHFSARKLDDARVFWWFDASEAHTTAAFRKCLADKKGIRVRVDGYVDMLDEVVEHRLNSWTVDENFGSFKIKKIDLDYYDSFVVSLNWLAGKLAIDDEIVAGAIDSITTYSGTLDYPFFITGVRDIKNEGTALTNVALGSWTNNVAAITADELGSGSTINRTTGAVKLVFATAPTAGNNLTVSYDVQAYYADNFVVKVVCP